MKKDVSLGFTSLERETSDIALKVEGIIPRWLSGNLIRVGAAKFEVGRDGYNHWFDGLAMLYRFSFRDGGISFGNQFIKGKTYKQAMQQGRVVYPEFATVPRQSWLGRFTQYASQQFTDNTSVNIIKTGKRFITMTETPSRLEFHPDTLDTLGPFKYNDEFTGQLTTAHPHYDFEKGEFINYLTCFSLKSNYKIYRIKNGSTTRELINSVSTDEPSYMHSFSITKNYVILAEYPLVIDKFKLILSGQHFIQSLFWKPWKGTKFLVINRHRGNVLGRFETAAFFAFHHVNAFEKNEKLILDILAYRDPSIIRTLYLKTIRRDETISPTPELRRYKINLENSQVSFTIPFNEFAEFPRINYQSCNGRDYSYIYGITSYKASGFLNKLIKLDIKNQTSWSWFKEYCYPGEPVFVAYPGGRNEDEGVVISVVLNTTTKKAFLLILDAANFQELAQAELPYVIPFNSHGDFFWND